MSDKKINLNIYQKLHKIQEAIIGLEKDKSAFGYKYVTGDKVISNIKPLMNKYGLLLKQEIISIDNVRQDYKNKKDELKNEMLTKAMMRFTWVDIDTGEKDENLFGANGQNGWDKGVGSALTYAERYFLLKYFHIATDEDDIDNPERKEEEAKELEKSKKILISSKNMEELKSNYLSLSKEHQGLTEALKNELKLKMV